MLNRFALTIVALLCAVTAQSTTAQRQQREISWVNPEIAEVQGLEHKVLDSKSLGHDVGYVVWTPPNYDGSKETRYPVLYFLHGAGGTEASDSSGFASRVSSAVRSGKFPPVVCVFPNGGMSGYRDKVESMIIDELIPLVDHDYKTKANASGRAIAGFSMGGAGSVRLSILHPELFCGAGSWGGALSRRGSGEDSPLLPAAKANAKTLKANNFALLTINGDQDHAEGFTPLGKVFKPLGISHTAVTLADTKHNLGHYYERSSDTMLAFLAKRLEAENSSNRNATNAKSTVRVLTIGNSFAENACKYLKEIAADGGVQLVIGTANLGGCTLERHASLAKQSASDPSTKPYKRTVDGEQSKLSLQDYLVADQWDFVTLQQMSALSFKPETFHPHIDELVSLVHGLAPQAKILIHQTWAYRPDAPLLQQWKLSQKEMHNGIVDAYGAVAKQFDATIIPVGAAFDAVRSTEGREIVVPDPNYDYHNPAHPKRPDQSHSLVAGWYWDTKGDQPRLKLDFKHANNTGCYLAGLVWYETLTGNDARQIKYLPPGVKAFDAPIMREVAHKMSKGPAAIR